MKQNLNKKVVPKLSLGGGDRITFLKVLVQNLEGK